MTLMLREYKAACAFQDALNDVDSPDDIAEENLLRSLNEFLRICDEESARRKCRLCGCTEHQPCTAEVEGEVICCGWMADDLCNFCHSTMFRDREIKTSRGDAQRIEVSSLAREGLTTMLVGGGH